MTGTTSASSGTYSNQSTSQAEFSSWKRCQEDEHETEAYDDCYETSNNNIIDNSRNIYLPIRLKCGVTTMCRPDVLVHCAGALDDLNKDLVNCFRLFPTAVHALIKRTRFWINLRYSYGSNEKPVHLNHSTAHHHHGWLLWARDRPDKVHGIEIYNCDAYRRMRLHWNGCGLILHEICHLIHQFTLPGGLNNDTIRVAFAYAQQSGLYDNVLRRDWAGKDVDCDMAYCMVDWKEFFAEMSTTYFCKSYHELTLRNRSNMEDCSPPICEPNVQTRIRQNYRKRGIKSSRLCSLNEKETKDKESGLLRIVKGFFSPNSQPPLPHCNKFYPFTAYQLAIYDRETYRVIDSTWAIISSWIDPYRATVCSTVLDCWDPWRRNRKPLLSIFDTEKVSFHQTHISDTVVL